MNEFVNKTSASQRQDVHFELVAKSVIKLCADNERRNADAPATWVSTRDIADDCNFSIYKTRYLLLKMAQKGWVQVTPHPINNALRWYICPKMKNREINDDDE
jgi:hypothetical protein